MPCIYVIYSDSKRRFYVGSSREDSAKIRLEAHNSRKTRSTKFGVPWKVIYEENALDYTTARKREIFLKSGIGRNWIKQNLIK